MSRRLLVLVSLLAALALPGTARAIGGDYVFEGGTPAQRSTVRAALNASAFDWGVVPARITIAIAPGSGSYAVPGRITLDAGLLDAGRFSWATVQDEYAHQVDFHLFDGQVRERLNEMLGGQDWCYSISGLSHDAYGCERFASTLVWAYWPSRDNAYRPSSKRDESAAMMPTAFRALLSDLLDAPLSARQQRALQVAANGR